MKLKLKTYKFIFFILASIIIYGFNTYPLDNTNTPIKSTSITAEKYQNKILYIEGTGEGTGAEIRLNDIPIGYLSPKGDSEMKHIQVELNIVTGKNKLSVYPSSNKGNIAVRLVRYTEGDWIDGVGGETLLLIKTKNDDSPVHKEITLSGKKPHWSWLNADVISDPKSHKEAIAFAKSFYNNLKDLENLDEIITALNPIYYDMSAIDPEITLSIRNKELRKSLLENSKKNIWQFDDIDTLSFMAIPVGNGRLYDLRRTDGSPLIRTSQNSKWDRITYRNIIGRKNGIWQFYR
ncbi:hypothetical protein J8L88_19710 [Aquimarina sp. MMG015]|uniref:hypothetical protein n=1 Tax=unclassified Aquimarina TaxID=2627091 RepID=UPI000E505595|nr:MULTISPECIES: hypothetical protein [unclassified Aquimarina]AXT58390.1 hypothetical protein D1815_22460 [Aquimarina sp. AD1]MBQ4805101.1 hypothetical protein [Aquimarina sp. MMG015]RKN24947.1 hypothetical protein D7035_10835 [Aquimarina sp. AD1]